jgi:hypothetical protein
VDPPYDELLEPPDDAAPLDVPPDPEPEPDPDAPLDEVPWVTTPASSDE